MRPMNLYMNQKKKLPDFAYSMAQWKQYDSRGVSKFVKWLLHFLSKTFEYGIVIICHICLDFCSGGSALTDDRNKDMLIQLPY